MELALTSGEEAKAKVVSLEGQLSYLRAKAEMEQDTVQYALKMARCQDCGGKAPLDKTNMPIAKKVLIQSDSPGESPEASSNIPLESKSRSNSRSSSRSVSPARDYSDIYDYDVKPVVTLSSSNHLSNNNKPTTSTTHRLIVSASGSGSRPRDDDSDYHNEAEAASVASVTREIMEVEIGSEPQAVDRRDRRDRRAPRSVPLTSPLRPSSSSSAVSKTNSNYHLTSPRRPLTAAASRISPSTRRGKHSGGGVTDELKEALASGSPASRTTRGRNSSPYTTGRDKNLRSPAKARYRDSNSYGYYNQHSPNRIGSNSPYRKKEPREEEKPKRASSPGRKLRTRLRTDADLILSKTSPLLGIQLPNNRGMSLEDEQDRQAIITMVVPNGPADLAGLEAGWVVHNINGREINTHREFIDACGGARPGAVLNLAVNTGGEELDHFNLIVHAKELNMEDVNTLIRIINGDIDPDDDVLITDIHSRLKYYRQQQAAERQQFLEAKETNTRVVKKSPSAKRADNPDRNKRYLWNTAISKRRKDLVDTARVRGQFTSPRGSKEFKV